MMNLETIMVSEISQSVKDKYRMIYFYVESNEQDKNRSIDTWNRLTAVRGEDEGVDWMKEGERISQRTYMHNPTDQCGDSQSEGGWRAG